MVVAVAVQEVQVVAQAVPGVVQVHQVDQEEAPAVARLVVQEVAPAVVHPVTHLVVQEVALAVLQVGLQVGLQVELKVVLAVLVAPLDLVVQEVAVAVPAADETGVTINTIAVDPDVGMVIIMHLVLLQQQLDTVQQDTMLVILQETELPIQPAVVPHLHHLLVCYKSQRSTGLVWVLSVLSFYNLLRVHSI